MFETTHCDMTTTEDDYTDGAGTKSQCVHNEALYIQADTMTGLTDKVCEEFGFSCPDPSSWSYDPGSGTLSTNFLVNADNCEVSPTDAEYQAFQQGEKKLWILDLTVCVRFVESRNPTATEASGFEIFE